MNHGKLALHLKTSDGSLACKNRAAHCLGTGNFEKFEAATDKCARCDQSKYANFIRRKNKETIAA